MRIAVVGTGIAGMVAAHLLHDEHEVIVFEASDYVGWSYAHGFSRRPGRTSQRGHRLHRLQRVDLSEFLPTA